MAGRQLPDPRHALQPGRAAEAHDRRRRRRGRRPDAGPHGGDRCARAAVRRRHLHPHRLRLARRRGQPRRRSASTTRARTSGPSAMPSGAGWSRSSRGRSAYSIIDSKAVGRFMPPVFPGERADRLPELARALGLDEGHSCTPWTTTTPPAARARFDHTALDDCRTEGLVPRQDALGAAHRHAAVLRLRAAARRDLHLPRAEDRCTRAAVHFGGAPAPTCSSPAR